MSNFQVLPRKPDERPICDAIESKSWKAALSYIEKRKKKNKDSTDEYLIALEFYVTCHLPSVLSKAHALIRLFERVEEKNFTGLNDFQLLQLYDEGVKVCTPACNGKETWAVCQLMQNAVEANKNDEKLAKSCFRNCLSHAAYDHALRIAISLNKNFGKKDRKYQFWMICMQWLCSHPHPIVEDLNADVGDVQKSMEMKRKLAQMYLKKFADNTPAHPSSPLRLDSIQTPQELSLFHKVCQQVPNADGEWPKPLSRVIEPNHPAAKRSWEFMRLLLKELKLQGKYEELFETCHDLLLEALPETPGVKPKMPEFADWLTWESIIVAANKTQKEEHISKLQQILTTATSNDLHPPLDKTYARNALLATVEYAFSGLQQEGIKIDQDGTSLRIFQLATYYLGQSKAGRSDYSIFLDIKKYLELLSMEEQHDLLSKRHDNCRMEHTEYLFRASLAAQTAPQCSWCKQPRGKTCLSCLEALVIRNIELYNEDVRVDKENGNAVLKGMLPTDMWPGDHNILIAAMCLMKMQFANEDPGLPEDVGENKRLLQAAAVLEYGASRSKVNPHFSLLLISIYVRLGAGALAMRAYQRLKIKGIQGDSLAYILFDRFSSLHPYEFGMDTSFGETLTGPDEHLSKIQRMYRKSRGQTSKNIWLAFHEGSYDSALKMVEVDNRLARSLGAAMTVIERRRFQRLTKPNDSMSRLSLGWDLLPSATWDNENDFVDNCDHEAFPNLEGSLMPTFQRLLEIGPPPSPRRMKQMLFIDELWAILTNESKISSDHKRSIDRLLSLLNTAFVDHGAGAGRPQASQISELTFSEIVLAAGAREVATLVIMAFKGIFPGDVIPFEAIDKLVEYSENTMTLLEAALQEKSFMPSGHFFDVCYCLHDFSQLLIRASLYVTNPAYCPLAKNNPEWFAEVLLSGQKLARRLQELKVDAQKRATEPGQIDKVKDAMTDGASIDDTNGESHDSDGIREAIADLMNGGDDFLEHFAVEMTMAWKDGLEGVRRLPDLSL